ncbi:MAG: MerR family transcriptional regulator [Clostridia bacterium]|nr:MerR family transcriptional regulator [Clostridia bacterium]
MKRINEIVKISGLSKRTLQYYDDIGLLKVARSKENYRLYSEPDILRLHQIMKYKGMGFELREIKELLDGTKEARRKVLEEKKTKVQSELKRLRNIEKSIKEEIYEKENQ